MIIQNVEVYQTKNVSNDSYVKERCWSSGTDIVHKFC